jgi:hypothetical protein
LFTELVEYEIPANNNHNNQFNNKTNINTVTLKFCYAPSNSIYFDIQCGKDHTHTDLGMTADNTGLNISDRNPAWSEITGLYWAWKNMKDIDYIGLCSYRRFFNFKNWNSTFLRFFFQLIYI